MATISELKEERETKTSALIKECGVFFAFSDKQFQENKTPLQEGEKYRRVFGGGFIPASKSDQFLAGLDEIENWYNSEIKGGGLLDAQILFELFNHEAFYTGNWRGVAEDFGFPVEDVERVYYSNRAEAAEYDK